MSLSKILGQYMKMGGSLQTAGTAAALGGGGYALAKRKDDGNLSKKDAALSNALAYGGLGLSGAGLLDVLENAPKISGIDALRNGQVSWSSPETLKSQEKLRRLAALEKSTKQNVVDLLKFKKTKDNLKESSTLAKMFAPKINLKRAAALGGGGLLLGSGLGYLTGKDD